MSVIGTILKTSAKVAGRAGLMLGKAALKNMFPSVYSAPSKIRSVYRELTGKKNIETDFDALMAFDASVTVTNKLLEQNIEVQKQQNDAIEQLVAAIKNMKKQDGGGILDTGDLIGNPFKRKNLKEPVKEPIKEEHVPKGEGTKTAAELKEAEEAAIAAKEAEKIAAKETSLVGKVTGKIGKGIKATKEVIMAAVKKIIGPKIVSIVAKLIPGEGLIAGIGFGVWRAVTGDWKGGIAEVVSGAASTAPVAGTAIAIGIQAGLLARDVYEAVYGVFPEDDPEAGERLKAVKDAVVEFIMAHMPMAKKDDKKPTTDITPAIGGGAAVATGAGAEVLNAAIKTEKDGSKLISSPEIEFNAKDISFNVKDMLIRYNEFKVNGQTVTGPQAGLAGAQVGDETNRLDNPADTGYRADPNDRRPENIPDELPSITPMPGETQQHLASRIRQVAPHLKNEQCVTLAKAAVGSNDSVQTWRRGSNAVTNELPIGTPVATFMDRSGKSSTRYDAGGTGSPGTGTTHAAVVAGYVKDKDGKTTGMQVWEQYTGSGGPRLKTYPVDKGFGEKNASNYFAIEQENKKGERVALGGENTDYGKYLTAQKEAAKEQKKPDQQAPVQQAQLAQQKPPPPPAPPPAAPVQQAPSKPAPPPPTITSKYRTPEKPAAPQAAQSVPTKPIPPTSPISDKGNPKTASAADILGAPSNVLIGAYLHTAA